MRRCGIVGMMAVALLCGACIQTAPAADEFAEVYSRGADGLYAFFTTEQGFYQGPLTLLRTPSGNVRGQARAELMSGTPVQKTTFITIESFRTRFGHLTAEIVVTPSGKGLIRLSNGEQPARNR